MTADRLAGSLAVGCWAAELCLSGRGPMGRGLSGRGGGPPGHRAAPSGSRVAGAPRRARRAAGSWGLGSLGCPVAGRWAVSVGLTDRGVVGLRSLICGVLGCGGGLWGTRPPARALRVAGSPGRWAQLLGWEASDAGSLRRRDAPGYGASGRRAMGRRVAETRLPHRGPPGCRAGGRGSPDRRAAPSGSRVAGAPRCARRAAGSWGLG